MRKGGGEAAGRGMRARETKEANKNRNDGIPGTGNSLSDSTAIPNEAKLKTL